MTDSTTVCKRKTRKTLNNDNNKKNALTVQKRNKSFVISMKKIRIALNLSFHLRTPSRPQTCESGVKIINL